MSAVVRVRTENVEQATWLALDAATAAGRRVRLMTEPCKGGVRLEVFGNKTGPDARADKIIRRARAKRGLDARKVKS